MSLPEHRLAASPEPSTDPASLVTTEAELQRCAARLARARRVALDVESNGLFKYRASLCTIQLAAGEGAPEVTVVDPMATDIDALAPLVGPDGPQKIIHDVTFDARILTEAGLVLGNVLDTSIAARMLGRTATGLASLLASELGVTVDKKLQHHDWSLRPIQARELAYLAEDVVHLGALADKLWAEVEARGIEDAVMEETRYRIAQAIAAARAVDPRPPWLRLKGVDRAPAADLPILRRLAELREHKAKDLDVPPYKVLGADVLFAIARARPRTMADLTRIRGVRGPRARALARGMLEAVRAGATEPGVPDEERAMLVKPRPPASVIKTRRARELRLTSWRKAEAKRRGIDEQVVLPGHCLQDLAGMSDEPSLDAIAAVPGIGEFRVDRDGEALLELLRAASAPEDE